MLSMRPSTDPRGRTIRFMAPSMVMVTLQDISVLGLFPWMMTVMIFTGLWSIKEPLEKGSGKRFWGLWRNL